MTGPDLYDFGVPAGDALRQALPPIVGDEGFSAWFGGLGHVRVPALTLPADAGDGIWFGVDLQPDSPAEQVVLGTARTDGTALRLLVNQGNMPGRLSVLLRDEDGRSLMVHAQGSPSVARRVVVTTKPRLNEVLFYEIQPWAAAPSTALVSEFDLAEAPSRFVFDQPFAFGGWVEDGQRLGEYAGRLANVCIGTGSFDETRLAPLVAASGNPSSLANRDLGNPSNELRLRFTRDVERLRGWRRQAAMTLNDMDDASALVYRWLVQQKGSMVPSLCRLLGVQLWLPGASERSRKYAAALLGTSPSLALSGEKGPNAPDFEWVPREQWLSEPAFLVDDYAVTRKEFVTFVRNKLGGAHFDERRREDWQPKLLAASSGLRPLGLDALVFQMSAIVGEAILAVAAARLEPLVAATSV
jgi:hypothetical protein